jgi:hypothetical protein
MPKGKPPAPAPTTRAQRALVAQFQRNARLAAERIERSPWTLGIRAVLAEAERTGDRAPIDDFVRRFKEAERRQFEAERRRSKEAERRLR